MIVEDEQQGKQRAEYGKQVLENLSQKLIHDFGKGLSVINLRQMRAFYLAYSIQQTVSAELHFNERHFYIDLVFYNRILWYFVIIDLKIGDLKHQDLGQMQMYVNYYDRFVKLNGL